MARWIRNSFARASLSFLLFFSSSAVVINAQTTAPFIDQETGIEFQRFIGVRTGFAFSLALSTDTNNTDFIGQFTFPLVNGAGWGGFSLTGDMEGPLLLAVWPDGRGNIVSSFRQAFNEDDNPPEVTGSFALRPIESATFVNNTFLSYTFLCEGCLDASLGLGPAAQSAEMGWGLASRAVVNPASSAAILGFHNSGFGDFRANLAAARSAEFDTWAALAGDAVSASAGARPFNVGAVGAGSGSDDDDQGGNGGFDSDSDDGFDSDSDFESGVNAGAGNGRGRN